MKRKVVYFSPNGYLGGAERFVLEAAQGHLKYGDHDPHVLFFNNGPAVEIFKESGINCTVLKNSFKLTNPYRLYLALKEIRSLYQRHQWHIINSTMPYAHIVASLALPFNTEVEKIWYQHGPVAGKLDLIASFFPYDKILFNTSYTQRTHEAQPLFYCDPSKHFICPYGIANNPPSEEPHPYPKETHSSMRKILTAGRICSWKAYETSIKALKNIISHSSQERQLCHLFIAGDAKVERDQAYYNKLRTMTKDLGLESHVTFLGRREDLNNLMAHCDFYLHTSSIPEPFGLVVAEAMMQKAFVIGTNKGGTTDILIDEVTGLSFDSTADNAHLRLESALLKAINLKDHNPDRYHQIKEVGHNHIIENFNIPKMIKNLEKLYG